MTTHVSTDPSHPCWTCDTLKPPLTMGESLRDLKWHYGRYREEGLPITTILQFLAIRTIQIIAYGKGWKEGE